MPFPRHLLLVAVGAVLVLGACGDDDVSGDNASEDGAEPVEGVEVEDGQSRDHLEGPIDYDRDPPSGGDHAPIWLNCGFYDEPVPNEHAVHALEHGVVWIAHDPDLPEADVDALRDLYESNPDRVIVAPYPGLDADVVAVAWERRLVATGPDDPRLTEFLEAYVNGAQSPEPRAACNGGIP